VSKLKAEGKKKKERIWRIKGEEGSGDGWDPLAKKTAHLNAETALTAISRQKQTNYFWFKEKGNC
jgi:hypothetical protein